MDELEEILITSDIGMETTMKIVDMLRTEVKTNNLTKPSVIKIRLAKIISSVINKKEEQKLCQDTLCDPDDRHQRRRQDYVHRQTCP